MHSNETELKLALSPDDLERLRRHPLVRAHRQGRAVTRMLSSVYYDTEDRALAKAGITVRVRSSGRQHVQTVKSAGSRTAGLFARREWEVPIASDTVNIEVLRATAIPALAEGDAAERLQPVFRTSIRRTAIVLAGQDWQVELALDYGQVELAPFGDVAAAERSARICTERSARICEAELELKKGEPAHLFHLAGELVRAIPARLTTLSKSDRGFALAAGTKPAAIKSVAVEVSPDMGVADAFQAIARNCMHHLLANEPALMSDHDGEALHQMRVALRRLRSAIKVFRPIVSGPQLAEISGELRWLLDHLGPARDGDVFLTEIVDPVVARYPGNPALASLRAQWREHRDRRIEAARAAVAHNRFTELLLAVGAWIEAGDWLATGGPDLSRPLGPFAAKVLSKISHRMRRAGGKHLDRLEPAERHRVRILGKQLRYAGEFFASLHPRKATRRYLAALAELQDGLGALNDIAASGPRLAGGHHDDERAWAAGVVAGWHEARRPGLMDNAQATWKQFRKAKPFWV